MNSFVKEVEVQKTLDALLELIIPEDLVRGLPSGSQVGLTCVDGVIEITKIVSFNSHAKLELPFHELELKDRLEILDTVKLTHRKEINKIAKSLVESYFIQPKVLRLIGIEVSPPFPCGNTLEDGDLSLLEDVYLRGRIYR
jgi:hypothetical protein